MSMHIGINTSHGQLTTYINGTALEYIVVLILTQVIWKLTITKRNKI